MYIVIKFFDAFTNLKPRKPSNAFAPQPYGGLNVPKMIPRQSTFFSLSLSIRTCQMMFMICQQWIDLLHDRNFCYIIGNLLQYRQISELHYRGLFCYIIGRFCYIIN